jgi:DNA adenine methylase
MRYFGGKTRIRKEISSYLESIRNKDQIYFEPFVGGGWILQEMTGKRRASDGNGALITLYQSLQEGWIPPNEVSEKVYRYYQKEHSMDDPMTAFCAFGCSFAGKWFGGYARSEDRNYALNAKNSLMKQLPMIKDVRFMSGLFQEYSPKGMLVYCDPPYQGTTAYEAFDGFDFKLFWNTMREWSKDNTVVISEYNAPDDFECILEIETKTDIRVGDGTKDKRIERLFRIKEVMI